jgi:hypothetical protein
MLVTNTAKAQETNDKLINNQPKNLCHQNVKESIELPLSN